MTPMRKSKWSYPVTMCFAPKYIKGTKFTPFISWIYPWSPVVTPWANRKIGICIIPQKRFMISILQISSSKVYKQKTTPVWGLIEVLICDILLPYLLCVAPKPAPVFRWGFLFMGWWVDFNMGMTKDGKDVLLYFLRK